LTCGLSLPRINLQWQAARRHLRPLPATFVSPAVVGLLPSVVASRIATAGPGGGVKRLRRPSTDKRNQCSITDATTGRCLRLPEAKFENIPKRLYSVLPACLFAFGVGSTEVADAELINTKIALPGNLGADLHFDPEIIRRQAQ